MMQLWVASISAWYYSLSQYSLLLSTALHINSGGFVTHCAAFCKNMHWKRDWFLLFKSAASIHKLCDVLSLSWVKWRCQVGGKEGWWWRFYCCKPVTKLGFELWSGRFRLSCVTVWISWVDRWQRTIAAAFLVSLSWNIDIILHNKDTNSSFYREHVQSLIILLAAEPWRAWPTTWRMTRGTAKHWTDTAPFIFWMMNTMKMMKRSDSNFRKLLLDVGLKSRLVLSIESSTKDFSSKITMVAHLFASHRGHSFEGPLLTPASWKQWRKQLRTSVTTWTLPKAWTPTKTRSITLQTEWPHPCDRLTSHLFTSRTSPYHPAQTLFSPFFCCTNDSPPRCGLPLLFDSGMPVSFLHLQPCVKCVEVSLFGLLCLSPFKVMSTAIICTV